MDYLFENLGDERFQEFCSALISKEFPNIQAFPVGQPDGGRDSIVYVMNSLHKEFIVFQVKYVKNANEERDVHKWLTDIIQGEAAKIDILIPKGAKRFYLLTNVRGTAHLDVGSKDKVNKILEENIKIPSICWWRDDLSILFEKDPLFKWSYPEIINGKDIINAVLFNNLNEPKTRREDVMTAYLVDQYEMDNEVKFQQIDLRNKLLDLFTDVPIKVKKYNEKNKLLKNTFQILANHNQQMLFSDYVVFSEEKQVIGAAEFLLHPRVQKNIERILLEGGPGQGKSTISQYVSQVHRVRLLNKVSEISSLPTNIKNTPIRLPFKIDLRHVASWVENKNPYQETLNEEYFKNNWSKNLESFLVGHIFSHSKLIEFTTTDLIAFFKISPILLVFDGFDEIANVEVRGEVIEFINKGIIRISSHAKSIQVIVTSRPAAFLDSVGFSVENYPHFELSDITPATINEYLEKWIKASDLSQVAAKELKKLVNEKLAMPHLKDLAKSPMQLAILISLLRTKGRSLPNKRTALYENYIELFFDRESEKSVLILENRELIINIHQYLAWVLHSEAELYKNSGFLHIDELKAKVKYFLAAEGHDTSIADMLFNVMKERVCALVSRVQGTFEFEVQPLREYFCAKYLYKTAPHSNAGAIKTGTKPERFHAILRNYYWQNVVRFFAGCADRGELDMIIQELRELQSDTLLKYTDYPRVITSQILSDYVFTQTPLKLQDVVSLIVHAINLGSVINQKETSGGNQAIMLPIECGRNEIVEECFAQLKTFPNSDYAGELIGIINNNPFSTLEKWQSHLPFLEKRNLSKWLEYAYKLRLIHQLGDDVLLEILKSEVLADKLKRLQLIINGNRYELIEQDADLKKEAFYGILNGHIRVLDKRYSEYSLRFLSIFFTPFINLFLFNKDNNFGNENITLLSYLGRYAEMFSNRNGLSDLDKFKVNDEIDLNISNFYIAIKTVLDMKIADLKNNLDPWDKIVEEGRRSFGDCFALKAYAIVASNIKSKYETYDDFENLTDHSLSLCKRVRCARMKSGSINYWEKQLNIDQDIIFSLSIFFTWATSKTFSILLFKATIIVNNLSTIDFSLLCRYVDCVVNDKSFNKVQQRDLQKMIKKINNNDKIIYLIRLRFSDDYGENFVYNNSKNHPTNLNNLNLVKFHDLITIFRLSPNNQNALNEIKAMYPEIDNYDDRHMHNFNMENSPLIPYEIAKEIMANCKHYPRIIGSLAEKACRIYAYSNLTPIGKIAVEERWFE